MLKSDPTQYLTEEENYLQHFWTPSKGDTVVHDGTTYTIKKITKDQHQAILKNLPNKAMWLQDLAWKPTLNDCDNIVTRFNAQVANDQILFKTAEQKCFFERPKTLGEYRDIIRQLRVLNRFQENK